MTDKVRFKKAFGNALKTHDFRKKGQSWYLHGSDSIVVLNLQKDDFSDLYYVNFGVWLLAFGNSEYPPENHCHVGARLEDFFPAKRELIIDACTINPEEDELPKFIDLLHSDVDPSLLCNSHRQTSSRVTRAQIIRRDEARFCHLC
jgi:hypothetical protein